MPVELIVNKVKRPDRHMMVEGKTVMLSPKQAEVMAVLLAHRGEYVSRQTIIEEAYPPPQTLILPSSVDAIICAMRGRLGPGVIASGGWGQGWKVA